MSNGFFTNSLIGSLRVSGFSVFFVLEFATTFIPTYIFITFY